MFCLRVTTDQAWAAQALEHIELVLADHAHCEMKAASNALSLAGRPSDDLTFADELAELAREEIEHFRAVLALLSARGMALPAPTVDEYAGELRKAAATLPKLPHAPLVDRFLVGALIEARSCERFKLMLGALEASGDPALADVLAVYRELFPAEARHYRTFVDFAKKAAHGDTALVEARLHALAEKEAEIVIALAARGGPGVAAARATIHG